MSTDLGATALTVFHARHARTALDFSIALRIVTIVVAPTGK